jgi:hypothetical protein
MSGLEMEIPGGVGQPQAGEKYPAEFFTPIARNPLKRLDSKK